MKTNIATSRTQSDRLLRCGVSADTADMCYDSGALSLMDYDSAVHERDSRRESYEVIPAWSLSALCVILPQEIKLDESPYDEVQEYRLLIYPFIGGWKVEYQYCEDDECYCLKCVHGTDLIEACVKAIEWLTSNGYKLNEQ